MYFRENSSTRGFIDEIKVQIMTPFLNLTIFNIKNKQYIFKLNQFCFLYLPVCQKGISIRKYTM